MPGYPDQQYPDVFGNDILKTENDTERLLLQLDIIRKNILALFQGFLIDYTNIDKSTHLGVICRYFINLRIF